MKAVVIVFSPSGHTLTAARMIRKSIEARGGTADIIDLTKDDTLLFASDKRENLAAKVGAFDVLFVGAPVYAGHAEHTVLRTIAMLPSPDEKRSKIAVPFISYGGAHSFVALEEMGRALKRKNYVPVLGIKLASFHTLSRSFRTKISEDRPGDAERRVIEDAASKVVDLCSDRESIRDGSASFAYTKMPMRFILKILSQEKIHAKFKTVSIVYEKCRACKRCIEVCPVNNFVFADGIVSVKNRKNCILCGECFYNCASDAIVFDYRKLAKKRLRDGEVVLESPLSAVYRNEYGYIREK